MTVIQVKKKNVLDIPTLFRYALAFIYEQENFTSVMEAQMKESIIRWHEHIEYKKSMGMSEVDVEHLRWLSCIATLLKENEEGKLDERKRSFKEHQIDYKKFYRLPEAYNIKEVMKKRAEAERLAEKEGYNK